MQAALRPTLLMLGMQLAAQAPRDAKQIEAALASNKPEEVAWAAHDARALGDRKLIVPLQKTLATWRRAAAPDVSLHLLDALVQLDAHMPASDLMPLIDTEECGVAAFVLLVREPKHNEAELFDLFRRDWPNARPNGDSPLDRRCLAIGNLLATQAPPGFASMLAEQVDLDLEIVVSEGVTAGNAVGLQRVNIVGRRPAHPKADPGWPPRPLYEFAHPVLRVKAVEVPMPRALGIQVTRRSSEDAEGRIRFQVGGPGADDVPPTDSLRWLCTVARLPAPATQRRLHPMPPQAFLAAATTARDQLQQFVDTLRERLVAARAMTEHEAKRLERKVAVVVHDERTDCSVPLPKIPRRAMKPERRLSMLRSLRLHP